MRNPLVTFNRWYDSINSSSLRLLIPLIVISPLFLAAYPPLLIKFGATWFYSCFAWVVFLLVMRRWWLISSRLPSGKGLSKCDF